MDDGFLSTDGKFLPAEIHGTFADPELVIEAAAAAKRFTMLAYSGGPLTLVDYPLPVVVDLAGMKIAAQTIPVVNNHGAKPIGETDRLTITARGLEAAGIIDTTTDDGQLITAANKGGIAWEASIGASVQTMEQYGKGEAVQVNGRTFNGPIYVARKTTLKDLSITRRGADVGKTIVTIAASTSPKGSPMSEDVTIAIAAERARVATVHQICASYTTPNITKLRDQAIAGTLNELELKAAILSDIRASRPEGVFSGGGDRSGPSVNRQTIAATLLVKSGQEAAAEKAYGAAVMEASRPLHRRSMLELAELSLRADGREVPDGRDAMLRAALSTGTFPVAIGDAANKSLQRAYAESPSTWETFAADRNAKDFKDNHSLRATWAGEVTEIGKGGEIKHGSIGEQDIVWCVDTYAKMYSIDRRDVINDDASMFSDVIPGLARAAKRGLNNLVWTTIMGNVGSFFSTGNKNLGVSSGALNAASLSARLTAMRKQTDPDGTAIDIAPAVLVVPPELEFAAKSLLQSAELWQSVAGTPTGNAVKESVTLEVESRLSNTAYTGNSTTAFYVFSGPQDVPVIVGYLDGAKFPKTESFGLDAEVDRLAYSWRVYHDFGAAYGDFRAAQKADGL